MWHPVHQAGNVYRNVKGLSKEARDGALQPVGSGAVRPWDLEGSLQLELHQQFDAHRHSLLEVLRRPEFPRLHCLHQGVIQPA